MVFAPDTEVALRTVVNLINTAANGAKHWPRWRTWTASSQPRASPVPGPGMHAELASVHELRERACRAVDCGRRHCRGDGQPAAARGPRAPQLMKHDGWDWHLHATTPEAPLADRMSTEAAMALVDVIRSKEMDRMLVCAAEDCDAVVLDLSRNRSKRYCDTGNCANRAHVAAYRARQAAS